MGRKKAEKILKKTTSRAFMKSIDANADALIRKLEKRKEKLDLERETLAVKHHTELSKAENWGRVIEINQLIDRIDKNIANMKELKEKVKLTLIESDLSNKETMED